MRRKENRDYGKILDYDPQWKGPLDIEREQTDFGFLVSFGIYLAVWICVGIYAISTGDFKNSGNPQARIDNSFDYHSSIDSSMLAYLAFGAIVFGIVVSFIYLFLLRHYPKTVVFTAIVLFFALLLVSIGVCSYQLATQKAGRNGHALYGLIMSVVAFIVMLILFIVYRKKVVIACGVIKEATKAVWFFPSSFLFPILPFILYGITLIFFGYTAVSLQQNPAMKNKESSAGHIYFFHAINIFGILWASNFIYGFSQMVLSGTFATWFWTMDKERVPSYTVAKFIRVTTRFHLGTIAFGSLIIAIVQAIKMLLKAASDRARNDGNNLGALLLSCLRGLCGIVENIVEYINSNAYIMCTVHGTKFYQSAKDAFNLLMRNVVSVVVVTDVTDMIIFLGNVIVIGTSLLGTWLYCHDRLKDDDLIMPMVVVGISTLMVSCCIFEILRTAVNTIFLCVLEDYERNDGSSERPYFMPYKLRQLLIQDE